MKKQKNLETIDTVTHTHTHTHTQYFYKDREIVLL